DFECTRELVAARKTIARAVAGLNTHSIGEPCGSDPITRDLGLARRDREALATQVRGGLGERHQIGAVAAADIDDALDRAPIDVGEQQLAQRRVGLRKATMLLAVSLGLGDRTDPREVWLARRKQSVGQVAAHDLVVSVGLTVTRGASL